MKIALLIEEGLEQIILTPETDTEKGIVETMHKGDREISVYQGSVYATRSGWMHQGSTIIVLKRTSRPVLCSPRTTDWCEHGMGWTISCPDCGRVA